MLRKSRILPIGLALLLFAGVSVSAQPNLPACAADFQAFCIDVQPGEGRLAACIKAHISDFSVTCKARLIGTILTAKECASSLKEQCGTSRNAGEAGACLRESLTSLSEICILVVLRTVLRRR
jgi:hypothetical protein